MLRDRSPGGLIETTKLKGGDFASALFNTHVGSEAPLARRFRNPDPRVDTAR